MWSIPIAGVNIPIVYSISIPNTEPTNLPQQAAIPFDNPTMFRLGVLTGKEHSRDAGPFPGGIPVYDENYTKCYCSNSSLNLHDGWEAVADNLTQSTNNYYMDTRVTDGEHTYYSSRQTVQMGFNAAYAAYRDRETRAVAVRFNFPDAAAAGARANGYRIYLVSCQADYWDRELTELKSTTYSMSNSWWINIPYINKQTGSDAYLEEHEEPEDEDPNEDDPEANKDEEDGGDGDHTPTYDPIPVPYKPTQGAATAGFITMYKLHQAAMMQFADDMFADNIWEALKLFFSNPMDFLVGVNLVPFDPPAPVSWKPKFGATAIFGHAYPAISNQYYDVDCGTVSIPKYWGSCFDYEPYTKIQIWLPYIGYRDLPVDEIMGCSINVLYRCDCLTGDCVAFVTISGDAHVGPQIVRVIAQFYGNCAVRVPFGSVSFDSAISNSVQLMGAAASGGLSAGAGAMMETGGAFGGLAAGAGAFADAAVNSAGVRNSAIGVVQGMKPNVMKGGAAGSSTGYMSIQKPYLIRRIPRLSLPSNYKGLKGYPCNIGGKLADFTGLAAVDDIQLNDIPAMEDERGEIMQWLKGGVLI